MTVRLIDADALIGEASTGCTDYVADELADWVQEAPTVDAIPVDWLLERAQQPLVTDSNPFGFVLEEWMEAQK